jgi:hypothetical protein
VKLTYTIDLNAAFNNADDATKADILDFVATHDFVIDEVAKQLLDGYTELGSHGCKGFDGLPHTPIDRARRLIAEGASECAASEIRRLARALASAVEERDKYREDFINLQHAWRQRYGAEIPS